jgi:glycosyltransferase involved in cell wall biosynthesis
VLGSYLNQEPVGEVIIVDDGSDDETREVLEELSTQDSRIRLICHDENRGLPAARNTGIKYSSLDYIMFGEDDLWLAEGHCKTLISHLRADNCDIIAGRLQPVSALNVSTILEASKEPRTSIGSVIDYSSLTGNFQIKTEQNVIVPFLHACALFRRDVFHELKYDEDTYKITYFREETDLYLRAYYSGFRALFCPHTVSFHLDRRTFSELDAPAGGCGAKVSLKDKVWNQINNVSFAWKNRHILNMLDIDYSSFIIRFFCKSLFSTLSS